MSLYVGLHIGGWGGVGGFAARERVIMFNKRLYDAIQGPVCPLQRRWRRDLHGKHSLLCVTWVLFILFPCVDSYRMSMCSRIRTYVLLLISMDIYR